MWESDAVCATDTRADGRLRKTYHAIVDGGDIGSNAADSGLNTLIRRKR
jgi:hypothetical protein